MKQIAGELRILTGEFARRHRDLDEKWTVIRLDASRWTLREILGHLIDSASNNHQRFTRLQLGGELHFPGYENEKWLRVEKWNLFGWKDILDLLVSYNLYLSHLMEHVDPECLENRWYGQDRHGEKIFTLEAVMTDYLRHFKEHLDHFETRLEEVRTKSEDRKG